MAKIKKSFLRSIIGNDSYDRLRGLSILYVPIYVVLTGLVFLLSKFFFWKILSTIFSILTGWSLFSLLFIGSIMLLCNIECNGEVSEYMNLNNGSTWKEDNINPKSYNLTIVWFIVLLALGITYGVISDREESHYKFLCTTYLVDHNNGVYHIIENDNCEDITNYNSLVGMKGHEIEAQTNYQLCTSCEEWYEDVMNAIDESEHYRR